MSALFDDGGPRLEAVPLASRAKPTPPADMPKCYLCNSWFKAQFAEEADTYLATEPGKKELRTIVGDMLAKERASIVDSVAQQVDNLALWVALVVSLGCLLALSVAVVYLFVRMRNLLAAPAPAQSGGGGGALGAASLASQATSGQDGAQYNQAQGASAQQRNRALGPLAAESANVQQSLVSQQFAPELTFGRLPASSASSTPPMVSANGGAQVAPLSAVFGAEHAANNESGSPPPAPTAEQIRRQLGFATPREQKSDSFKRRHRPAKPQ